MESLDRIDSMLLGLSFDIVKGGIEGAAHMHGAA